MFNNSPIALMVKLLLYLHTVRAKPIYKMLPGFFITVVLLGALQGFIISTLLFVSKVRKLSSRLLAILIFLIALASISIYLNTQPWYVYNQSLQLFHALVPWFMVMPMGPLIYFYLRSYIEPDKQLSINDKRRFYPVLIDILPQIIVLLFIIAAMCGYYRNSGPAIGRFIDAYNVYADHPAVDFDELLHLAFL